MDFPTGSITHRMDHSDHTYFRPEELDMVAVDDNSNLSESLHPVKDDDAVIIEEFLDLNPPPAEPSTSAPESSNALLGKKPSKHTAPELVLEDGKADKKRKRSYSEDEKLFREPSDDSSDESIRAVSDNSMDFINLIPLGEHPGGSARGKSSDILMTPQEIQLCDDVHTLQNQCMVFYQKYKLEEANSQTLKMEKRIEHTDYLKEIKQLRSLISDAESRSEVLREELYKQILEALEHDFNCCICDEVFVQPTVADCGHTFCGFCIEEWTREKPECPICRKLIRNPTKHIEIDNFLVKIHTMMSEEIKTKRDIQIAERIAQQGSLGPPNAAPNAAPNADFGMLSGIPLNIGEMSDSPNAHNNNAATTGNGRRRSARIQARAASRGQASRAPSTLGAAFPPPQSNHFFEGSLVLPETPEAGAPSGDEDVGNPLDSSTAAHVLLFRVEADNRGSSGMRIGWTFMFN